MHRNRALVVNVRSVICLGSRRGSKGWPQRHEQFSASKARSIARGRWHYSVHLTQNSVTVHDAPFESPAAR